MKTISEYITILNNTKNNMISKLNSHGLNVSQSDSIYSLSNKIGDIESGIKPNIFSQTTQPETYDGIWINTDQTVNKLAQVEDFLSEWNSNYVPNMPIGINAFGYIKYDNKVYIIGGYNTGVTNTNYIYDIITNTWTIGTPIPQAKHTFSCTACNGKIYCVGGSYNSAYASLNTNYIYDITGDSWSTGTIMPQSICDYACDMYGENNHYIAGYNSSTRFNTNYIYNTISDSWTAGQSVPISSSGGRGIINNGKFYYIGGYTTVVINTNYIYDIADNSWTTGTAMPQAKHTFGITQCNNKIYCIGGAAGPYLNTNYIYNITGNSWTTGTAMPTTIYNIGIIEYNNLIYIFGGYNGSFQKINHIYSPDGPVNIALYNSDTLIMQHLSTTNTYNTILTNSNSFIGGFKYYFTDVAINSINADIYYGDGDQWIKIKSAT
jgi:hypothetical protein